MERYRFEKNEGGTEGGGKETTKHEALHLTCTKILLHTDCPHDCMGRLFLARRMLYVCIGDYMHVQTYLQAREARTGRPAHFKR